MSGPLSDPFQKSGVPDREAEGFFGYVLRLSPENGPSALDPESPSAGRRTLG